ncbi:MAG: ribbon-helix-helix domain-containing protein [Oscillospiraceae bacterium]|nr:ribbon-helix-helix domain-containing protein [Oscillospiraceae bacterium]
MLNDDVVAGLDALAHKSGISRSGLVNRILADHLLLETPEKRVETVFRAIIETVSDEVVLPLSSSAWMLQLKSAIQYRYNPTLRYTVEFLPGRIHSGCEFRVSSRTRSDALLSRLIAFFEIWSQLEASLTAKACPGGPRISIRDGTLQRALRTNQTGEKDTDGTGLGVAIGRYILLFDRALKLSFHAPHGVDMEAYDEMSEFYREYMKSTVFPV